MWGPGPCGAPMWGVWWVFPLLGLLFIVVMMMFCARMMPRMMGGSGMCGHGGRHTSETDDPGSGSEARGTGSASARGAARTP
jgi:hypothetical protein